MDGDTTNMPQNTPRRRWRVWTVVALLAAALLITPQFDQRTSDYLTRADVRTTIVDHLGPPLGLAIYAFVLAILVSFPNWRRLFVGFFAAVLLSTGLLHALKWSIGRARPRVNAGWWEFHPFSFQADWDSFPSGHTTASTVLFMLLALYFPRGRWVFYVMALLVGFERVLNDWHYPSDVIGGYGLAIFTVWLCYRKLGASYYRTNLDQIPRPAPPTA